MTTSDLNNDGLIDIYVCNDYLEHDYLYINQGDGKFDEQIHSNMKHTSNFSMGVDAADFNNDGLVDIFVADMAAADNYRTKVNMSGMAPKKFWKAVDDGFHFQYMYNTVNLNIGNGSFSDVAQLTGMAQTDWSWSPLVADFDNDGLKDVYVSNGLRKEARNNDFTKYKKKKLMEMEHSPVEKQIQILKTIIFRQNIYFN